LLATSCKDKILRLFDPRQEKVVAESKDHDGAKGSRNLWLTGKKDLVFSCGFTKTSERVMALFDPRRFNTPLTTQKIDASSSSLMPFYDPDNSVIFLAGKGDGNIRYYEVGDSDPFIFYLSEYKSNAPQSGMACMPKTALDVMRCEIMRFLKLTPQGQVIPLRFEVPRADNQFFQDDLFPDTWDGRAAMTSQQWFGGANNPPNLISLDPSKRS